MLPNIKTKLIQGLTKERDKYITQDRPSKKKDDELMQATAATVGFVSELVHRRKEKKTEVEATNVYVESAGSEAPDVKNAPRVGPDKLPVSSHSLQYGTSDPAPNPKDLADAFLYRHSSQSFALNQPVQPLETPVLIPQRRPNNRARGFAPAYAPILNTFDISQDAFLDYVITLNASLTPNPYLNAINLASFAGEASPELLVGVLVGEAIAMATDAIMEAQSRMESNRFLEKVNEGFFAPRGLFAFFGTWRPEVEGEPVAALRLDGTATTSNVQIDIVKTSKSVAGGGTKAKDAWCGLQRQVQQAMVPAHGDFTKINSAPLVWPSAEEVAAVANPGDTINKKNRFDRASLWMDNHVDKHSQVKWTQEYPGHPLAGSLPKPEFRSRYADPSHAASSGDVVALLTGGQWHTKEDEKKKEKEARKHLEKEEKKAKKLKLKEEKLKAKEEKLKVRDKVLKAKDETNGDGNSKHTVLGDDVKAKRSGEIENTRDKSCHKTQTGEKSKVGAEKDPHDSGKEDQVKKKTGYGLGSLLKYNLLYLIVVQHPSLAGNVQGC